MVFMLDKIDLLNFKHNVENIIRRFHSRLPSAPYQLYIAKIPDRMEDPGVIGQRSPFYTLRFLHLVHGSEHVAPVWCRTVLLQQKHAALLICKIVEATKYFHPCGWQSVSATL